MPPLAPFNPDLDLELTRVIQVPRALVWKAWTKPEHLKPWFAPKPVETIDCEIDLRPGGIFRTVMVLPDGTRMDNAGTYLDIVEEKHLVWCDVLAQGWRPSTKPFFTAAIMLEDFQGGTKYTARALHGTTTNKDQHEQMGFHTGWGIALDQMVAMIEGWKN